MPGCPNLAQKRVCLSVPVARRPFHLGRSASYMGYIALRPTGFVALPSGPSHLGARAAASRGSGAVRWGASPTMPAPVGGNLVGMVGWSLRAAGGGLGPDASQPARGGRVPGWLAGGNAYAPPVWPSGPAQAWPLPLSARVPYRLGGASPCLLAPVLGVVAGQAGVVPGFGVCPLGVTAAGSNANRGSGSVRGGASPTMPAL